MRTVFLFVITLFVSSCDSTEKQQEEKVSYQQVNTPNDTVKLVHMDADTTKLLLMGRGSEPGWICEFFQTRVRFLFDQGTDSLLIGGLDFSNQMRMSKGFENFKLESRNKDTIFETLPGPCKEETTGEARPMQMRIILGKREFKGCAWVPN